MTKVYGVDCGDSQLWVSVDRKLGVGFNKQSFLDFEWYEGSGVLVTENTTLYARPQTKTASLAQYFTFDEVCEFFAGCKDRGIEVLVHPNKHSWKIVNTFVELGKQGDPRLADYSHIDFGKITKKGDKYKSNELDALGLAFCYEFKPESLSRPKVRNPDKEWDKSSELKHEIINDANRRLNNQRAVKSYDNPDFSRLKALLPEIDNEINNSDHPGAKVLRQINAIPRYKANSKKYGFKKGDLMIDGLSPVFKAVWATMTEEDGTVRPMGFQMLWTCLGGSAFRFRSGVAGSQVRYNLQKEIREHLATEAGLPLGKKSGVYFLTRDDQNPYYAVQKQAHRDVKNAVKFVNETLQKLLE